MSGGASTSNPLGAGLADAELDRRWLAGDERALAEAHRRYGRRLEGVAYRILRNHADAEDVVQRVFQALPGAAYRGSASLWSYLYRAAVNGSFNVLRAQRRSQEGQERLLAQRALETPATTPEAQVLEGEMLAAVARALLEVSPRHRRALVLRIHHGLSNTEIAAQEGVPLATVGTWLRRGRLELGRALRPLLRELERQRR